MPLTNSIVEQIAAWCAASEELADIRSKARSEYFGYDEAGEVHYMEGAGNLTSRERRFLGWFILTFKLPDGRSPAELAATAILSGSELASAIDSIKGVRHVLAMVTMVNSGRGLILRLEDEEFIVENRQLSRLFNRDDAIYAHIIPAGRRGWLVGPGWLQWPIGIMPGMQAMLKKFQLNPIELERFLQQREDPSKDRPKVEMPRDSSLEAAVARMTEAAKAEDCQSLNMTPTQWKKLVFSYMKSSQINAFSKEIMNRVGDVDSVEDINKWIGLAMNIWNNTPQPDRGGKSPFEISREYDVQSGG
ncbi:hypothetical protein [Dehalococcoides mccartyi]|jgi:hypothetical protein|uniref:hypothetical protein n=1 Tax=Dehalococcoides mccartyi TaxID=61435 RepID=UPI002FCADCD9